MSDLPNEPPPRQTTETIAHLFAFALRAEEQHPQGPLDLQATYNKLISLAKARCTIKQHEYIVECDGLVKESWLRNDCARYMAKIGLDVAANRDLADAITSLAFRPGDSERGVSLTLIAQRFRGEVRRLRTVEEVLVSETANTLETCRHQKWPTFPEPTPFVRRNMQQLATVLQEAFLPGARNGVIVDVFPCGDQYCAFVLECVRSAGGTELTIVAFSLVQLCFLTTTFMREFEEQILDIMKEVVSQYIDFGKHPFLLEQPCDVYRESDGARTLLFRRPETGLAAAEIKAAAAEAELMAMLADEEKKAEKKKKKKKKPKAERAPSHEEAADPPERAPSHEEPADPPERARSHEEPTDPPERAPSHFETDRVYELRVRDGEMLGGVVDEAFVGSLCQHNPHNVLIRSLLGCRRSFTEEEKRGRYEHNLERVLDHIEAVEDVALLKKYAAFRESETFGTLLENAAADELVAFLFAT